MGSLHLKQVYAGRRGRDGAVEDAVDGAAASEGVQLLFDDRLRRRNNEDMLDESKKLDYIIAGHHSSFNCWRVRCGITKTKFYSVVLWLAIAWGSLVALYLSLVIYGSGW